MLQLLTANIWFFKKIIHILAAISELFFFFCKYAVFAFLRFFQHFSYILAVLQKMLAILAVLQLCVTFLLLNSLFLPNLTFLHHYHHRFTTFNLLLLPMVCFSSNLSFFIVSAVFCLLSAIFLLFSVFSVSFCFLLKLFQLHCANFSCFLQLWSLFSCLLLNLAWWSSSVFLCSFTFKDFLSHQIELA